MTNEEREEIEEYLPEAIAWLEDQAITRYLRSPEGFIDVDRAWDLAAMLRVAHIKGRLSMREEVANFAGEFAGEVIGDILRMMFEELIAVGVLVQDEPRIEAATAKVRERLAAYVEQKNAAIPSTYQKV